MAGLSAKAAVDLMMLSCSVHLSLIHGREYWEYRVQVAPLGCYKDNTRKGLRKKLTAYVEELIEAEQAALTTGVRKVEALASDLPPKCGQIWKDASGVRYLIVQRMDMGWPSFAGISPSGKWIDFDPTWTYAGSCTGFTGETE